MILDAGFFDEPEQRCLLTELPFQAKTVQTKPTEEIDTLSWQGDDSKIGMQAFDTENKQPVWWDGAQWSKMANDTISKLPTDASQYIENHLYLNENNQFVVIQSKDGALTPVELTPTFTDNQITIKEDSDNYCKMGNDGIICSYYNLRNNYQQSAYFNADIDNLSYTTALRDNTLGQYKNLSSINVAKNKIALKIQWIDLNSNYTFSQEGFNLSIVNGNYNGSYTFLPNKLTANVGFQIGNVSLKSNTEVKTDSDNPILANTIASDAQGYGITLYNDQDKTWDNVATNRDITTIDTTKFDSSKIGFQAFDQTNKQPVWWDGEKWGAVSASSNAAASPVVLSTVLQLNQSLLNDLPVIAASKDYYDSQNYTVSIASNNKDIIVKSDVFKSNKVTFNINLLVPIVNGALSSSSGDVKYGIDNKQGILYINLTSGTYGSVVNLYTQATILTLIQINCIQI